jgi:hypothetical protein
VGEGVDRSSTPLDRAIIVGECTELKALSALALSDGSKALVHTLGELLRRAGFADAQIDSLVELATSSVDLWLKTGDGVTKSLGAGVAKSSPRELALSFRRTPSLAITHSSEDDSFIKTIVASITK